MNIQFKGTFKRLDGTPIKYDDSQEEITAGKWLGNTFYGSKHTDAIRGAEIAKNIYSEKVFDITPESLDKVEKFIKDLQVWIAFIMPLLDIVEAARNGDKVKEKITK